MANNVRYTEKEWKELKEQETEVVYFDYLDNMRNILEPEKYKELLDVLGNCRQYSLVNSVLIHYKMPNASIVKSFSEWKKEKVNIKKDEKGIKIIMPIKKNINKTNENDEMLSFKVGYVFDISQTDANVEEYKSKFTNEYKIKSKKDFIEKLEKASGTKIEISSSLFGNASSYSLKEKKIKIKGNMSENDMIKNTVRRVAHVMVSPELDLENEIFGKDIFREEKLIINSIYKIVCSKFGISVDEDYSPLKLYTNKDKFFDFQKALKTIKYVSDKILNEFEEKQKENLKQNSLENEI